MRLIDADQLWMVTEGYHEFYERFEVDNAPTIDAVPVVRCKDCANRGWEDECPLYESAYITGRDEGSNFYCAWGERREDG